MRACERVCVRACVRACVCGVNMYTYTQQSIRTSHSRKRINRGQVN